jgi:hypothetical protein
MSALALLVVVGFSMVAAEEPVTTVKVSTAEADIAARSLQPTDTAVPPLAKVPKSAAPMTTGRIKVAQCRYCADKN